ncbi:MAG: phosphoribosylformimino-5-aminoimidazole carboxamide ribotide isomerase [Victivallales bacterium]|nr:phosphoribosylformimino-5-aminoimidazole carboxamide ribotide isomerase [Victivallales bacterium]
MHFRPCIDLHEGKVKQIVGSTLRDDTGAATNFVSALPPSHYADLYYQNGLTGGHVIQLGAGCVSAAREALSRHPGNLQVGGGVTPDNGPDWLAAGASKVIVTSYLFQDGELDFSRVRQMSLAVGRERLVIDLSCRPMPDGEYRVACNRWQTICKLAVERESLTRLAEFCSEFLVHAVQVEGLRSGIDSRLVSLLADHSPVPVTYAGGVRSLADVRLIEEAGQGRVDFTVGSALDLFGGTLPLHDLLVWR